MGAMERAATGGIGGEPSLPGDLAAPAVLVELVLEAVGLEELQPFEARGAHRCFKSPGHSTEGAFIWSEALNNM
ncbi:hypothetical protein Nepgr_026851 [Nepenthes gracilis]|uniref:Uncharacterized protein n=1 Tax=Nepenthes gracilis TaxID=150966 RepID=A0AAD3T7W6_NEPGR|nr:hypothetical protein Nepgr_026851 [Nepenthes gracilis]